MATAPTPRRSSASIARRCTASSCAGASATLSCYIRAVSRFGLREASVDDADGIARAHTASWRTSYRGILPDTILDRIDVGQRVTTRRQILRDRSVFQLVAYDLTHGDIVGFCDA